MLKGGTGDDLFGRFGDDLGEFPSVGVDMRGRSEMFLKFSSLPWSSSTTEI